MDGAHDMGGARGFGPVVAEADEPVFHGEWERRTFALATAMYRPGQWNIDMVRFARENRPPEDYLSKSYFQLWLSGLEQLLAERGLAMPDEIAAGRMLHPPKAVPSPLAAAEVAPVIARGSPSHREPQAPARFRIGDRVRTRNISIPTHTRLPRYVRGHAGTIELIHGCHVFPDSNARGRGEDPQWLYTVSFAGRDLWGAQSDPAVRVSVDAWEPYLEPVDQP